MESSDRVLPASEYEYLQAVTGSRAPHQLLFLRSSASGEVLRALIMSFAGHSPIRSHKPEAGAQPGITKGKFVFASVPATPVATVPTCL